MRNPLILKQLLAVAIGIVLTNSGCNQKSENQANDRQPIGKPTDNPVSDHQHQHAEALHGGTIVSLGADSYHAEALLESNGTLRLFMLGRDDTRVQEVDLQTIKAYAKQAEDLEVKNLELTPDPQPGDSAGKTSQFVAAIPADLLGKSIRITIPNLVISGERFRVALDLAANDSQFTHEPMGKPVASSDEEAMYLTPGGKYTSQDIAANGKTVPTVKFKGIRSNHDDKPMPGDRICPISKTKANDQFLWVIDGKSYTFCCPPCIDEYVRLAKEQPDSLLAPEAFIKE
jgi:hypothetical protein